MALSNLTKVQTVGIGSNIEVVGVITTGQFKSGTSNLHSTGVELTNLNVSGIATIGGNLSIGGTLTYQDVTNIDSVGLITARSGINCGGDLDITGQYLKIENAASPEIQLTDTNANNSLCFIRNSSGNLRLSADNNNVQTDTSIRFLVDGGEKARITSGGALGINTSIPSTSQDLTINGASNYKAGILFKQAGVNQYRFMTEGGTGNVYYDVYGIGGGANGDHVFRTKTSIGATEVMRITETGLVGINEASPGTHLHVNSGTYNGVATFESTDANAHILIKDNNTHANGTYFGVEGNDFRFITHNGSSSTEKLRITNAGNIQHRDGTGVSYFNGASEYIFGSTTSSPPAGGSEARVQVHDYKTRAQLSINAYMNNAGGPFMNFLSSRSGTPGTLGTKCLNGDSLGDIRFAGDNGTNYNSVAYGAQIYATAASTPGDGDTTIAGRLKFVTGTANQGSLPVVMELREDGQLNLKRGRVNDAGHMVYRAGGRIAGTATVSFDIPVLSDGNIYWIEAFYTHHSLSYGGYLYGVYGAYSGHSGLQINNTIGSSTAGGTNVGTWSVSRGNAGQPVVVAKSAGSYGGYGHWWIHVHAGTTPNL